MRCHACACALVSLHRTPISIDQFAVAVHRSESLRIRHASLDSLGLWYSALHEDQVTGAGADLSHRAIYI